MAGKKTKAKKGRGRGRTKTDAKAIAAAERQQRALELRKAGMTLQEIANQLDYAQPCGAYKAIKAALAKLPVQAVQELRDLESERLDALQVNIWMRALNGNVKAIQQVLAIMARRARLLGLDVPAESVVDLTSGGKPIPFACDPGFGDWQPPEFTPEEAADVAALGGELAELAAEE